MTDALAAPIPCGWVGKLSGNPSVWVTFFRGKESDILKMPLGIQSNMHDLQAHCLYPRVCRQHAWGRVRDYISSNREPAMEKRSWFACTTQCSAATFWTMSWTRLNHGPPQMSTSWPPEPVDVTVYQNSAGYEHPKPGKASSILESLSGLCTAKWMV